MSDAAGKKLERREETLPSIQKSCLYPPEKSMFGGYIVTEHHPP